MTIQEFMKVFNDKYEKNKKRMKIIRKLFGVTK